MNKARKQHCPKRIHPQNDFFDIPIPISINCDFSKLSHGAY